MKSVCHLQNVGKSFDRRPVIQDFSIGVVEGEMLALTGPSGSGKSTLLHMMGLLVAPDTGSVQLFGGAAPGPGSKKAMMYLRHKIAFLFQNYALIETATVAENVRVASAYSTTGRDPSSMINEALQKVGLKGYADRKIHTLSGGEQQRVAIARTLVKPCSLVLADEPTAALDDENRNAVLSILAALASDGKAVVVATHDPFVAQSCARQVAISKASSATH